MCESLFALPQPRTKEKSRSEQQMSWTYSDPSDVVAVGRTPPASLCPVVLAALDAQRGHMMMRHLHVFRSSTVKKRYPFKKS